MNVLYPAALAVSTFSAVQEFEATGAVKVLSRLLDGVFTHDPIRDYFRPARLQVNHGVRKITVAA
jgi:hypothetical protein